MSQCPGCNRIFAGPRLLKQHSKTCQAASTSLLTSLVKRCKPLTIGLSSFKRAKHTLNDELGVNLEVKPNAQTNHHPEPEALLTHDSYPSSPSPPSEPVSFSRSGRRRRAPRALRNYLPTSLVGLPSHFVPLPRLLAAISPIPSEGDPVSDMGDQPSPSSTETEPLELMPIRTLPSEFSICRKYARLPKHNSEDDNNLESLCDYLQIGHPITLGILPMMGVHKLSLDGSLNDIDLFSPFYPFENIMMLRLLKWRYDHSTSNSNIALDTLVDKVLLSPDFEVEHLRDFCITWELDRLDKLDTVPNPFHREDGWHEASIKIKLPKEHVQYVTNMHLAKRLSTN
ncbi:hypothetical protein CERSUDRAFT_71603 [Gelatoporia subvermispora B]|uniref:Uncharacterized protein n=1 Tax=Ceriporiopsis subvermispora (strain B) TaxID=914234 RepID=M2RMN3_CERS8|nr:hypothetical protein CERSUDRAFT_71603 [Gelatoporia subvermispora B]